MFNIQLYSESLKSIYIHHFDKLIGFSPTNGLLSPITVIMRPTWWLTMTCRTSQRHLQICRLGFFKVRLTIQEEKKIS